MQRYCPAIASTGFDKSLLMKRIFAMMAILVSSHAFGQTADSLPISTTMTPIEIMSVRASELQPVPQTNMSKKQIDQSNVGYDLPIILNMTPSFQANSDAGNGIGYTGFRIRGTDPTRINISINGIPYNDAESQGTFLVNLPDLLSSANSIQIQRGVGTSTSGSGSFGGSININTNDIDTIRKITFNNSYGSFRTMKNTLLVNNGLIGKKLNLSGRISHISSAGYVDRAATRLQSIFGSALYMGKKYTLRLNVFSGAERTNAAWFGINQTTLDTNRTYNPAGTEKPGTPYDNETDNYKQTHYQAFLNWDWRKDWKFNFTTFLTRGKGYFEQYKASQDLGQYGLQPVIQGNDTLSQTDLIRQLWLDNYFYGVNLFAQYKKNNTNLFTGISANSYDGGHFGIIKKSVTPQVISDNYRWYDLDAKKSEISSFVRWSEKINANWETYTDMQIRYVNYEIQGFRANPTLMVNSQFVFFNPKLGLQYNRGRHRLYLTYGRSSKEPNRDDFETAVAEKPKPETLHDWELGYKYRSNILQMEWNAFHMMYRNQLVLTGKVNDVYAYTRTNIPQSYRSGIEWQFVLQASKKLQFTGNATYSMNKIKNFTEYIDDYDNGTQKINKYSSTAISFSPSWTGAAMATLQINNHLQLNLKSKYVGKQYLDNTSNENRKLDAYHVEDLMFRYEKAFKSNRKLNIYLQVNNIFSRKYVANGYTFSYVYGGAFSTENYYFPMATRNWMAGVGIEL
jgi:iron complex outermembrane receptor protein